MPRYRIQCVTYDGVAKKSVTTEEFIPADDFHIEEDKVLVFTRYDARVGLRNVVARLYWDKVDMVEDDD